MKIIFVICFSLITAVVSDEGVKTKTKKISVEPEDDKNTTESTTERFYKNIHETISNRSHFKVFPKRTDCIVDELKKAQFHNSSLEANENTTVDVFKADEVFMRQLDSAIDEHNINCIVPGAIALVFIVIVMIIILSCIVCLTRGDLPMNK
jgi:hypothetical protein